METNGFVSTFKDYGFRYLSEEQKKKIHYAALYILEKVGVKVLGKAGVDILRDAGARVEGDKVFIPQHLVKKALSSAPSSITLYDRNGDPAIYAHGRNVYYGAGPNCTGTQDYLTGKRRDVTIEDVENTAVLCDYLPNFDFAMSMGYISGMPSYLQDVHQFYSLVTHTTKPICFSVYDLEALKDIVEMSIAIRGNLKNLQDKPLFAATVPPTPPLVQSEQAVDRLIYMADNKLPVIGDPAATCGGTCPSTIAGALVQATAESLSGLVIHQLRGPGSPYIFSGLLSIMDMSTFIMPYGAPEQKILCGCMAEMSQFYDLPFYGLGGCSDSKVPDQQAAIEAAFSVVSQALCGANLVHDVGFLESGLLGSLEMLVVNDEIIGMAKRMLGKFNISDEELALDVIERVGPAGEYMSDEHTYMHFKDHWFPTLMDRKTHENWLADGGSTMGDRVKTKVKQILDTHKPAQLQDKVSTELKSILDRAYKKAGL